jgi:hypothetical protein
MGSDVATRVWFADRPSSTVTSDLDIYRAANALLKSHGDGAWDHATQRALTLDYAGDIAGRDVWVRVANAIRETLRKSGALQ